METKLTRIEWIEAGMDALVAEGPSGLRIMSIALKLGVTKGSFYWHFDNIEAFREAVLKEWEYRLTDRIVGEVESTDSDYFARLTRLTQLAGAEVPKLTLAIRSWALVEPMARAAIDRVDKNRIDYLRSIIKGLGWTEFEAGVLARWGYGALIGHFFLGGQPLSSEGLEVILKTFVPGPREK